MVEEGNLLTLFYPFSCFMKKDLAVSKFVRNFAASNHKIK